VREADVLMHVVDISHPDFEDQVKVVNQTLADIGAKDKPVYMVFNKIDAYHPLPRDEFSVGPEDPRSRTLEELEHSWMSAESQPCIFISAKQKIRVDKLRSDLYRMVEEVYAGRYPFENFLWK
ncbi:MAG: GTPase HflX, partial [Bacteroidales bacterium]